MKTSPLHTLLESRGGVFSPYALPAREGEASPTPIALCLTFGQLELEYAALRKGCVLIDQPQRAVIEVVGPDRLDFLNRMLTQELRGLAAGEWRRSFWLNRKGRVDADLRVVELGDRTLLELDAHTAEDARRTLSSYVVMEDVILRPLEVHRFSLHGPRAPDALARLWDAGAIPTRDGTAAEHRGTSYNVTIVRDDSAGEPGFEICLAPEHATDLAQRLLAAQAPSVRLAGWHAYNIARIEWGTPLYLLDFSRDSLPAETGVFAERVSLTKGCYLGQEIVARLHARGTPKQRLAALRFDDNADPDDPGARLLPESGSELRPSSDADEPAGAITSSTLSPMLAGVAVAFAMVRTAHAQPGTRLLARAEGRDLWGVVQPGLGFLPRPGAQAR